MAFGRRKDGKLKKGFTVNRKTGRTVRSKKSKARKTSRRPKVRRASTRSSSPKRRRGAKVAKKNNSQNKRGFLSKIDTRVKHYGFGLLYGGVVQEPTEQLTNKLVGSKFGQFFNLTDDAARPLILGAIDKMFTDGRGTTSQFLKAAITAEGANTGRKATQGGSGLLSNLFN